MCRPVGCQSARRVQAFTFSGPRRSSAYRPDASGKARAVAVADWKAWNEGLVGRNGVGKHPGPVTK